MALRIPGKGVSAAHIPYCFIQNAKPCSLSANWGYSMQVDRASITMRNALRPGKSLLPSIRVGASWAVSGCADTVIGV